MRRTCNIYKIHFVSKGDIRDQRNGFAEEDMAGMKFSTILLFAFICIAFFFSATKGEVYPYPGDCTKYQHCDNTGCFILSCGTGTEFNPAIGTCDYPLQNRQDCGNRG